MTRTRIEPRTTPRPSARRAVLLVSALAALATTLLVIGNLSQTSYVERMTVLNPTPYDLGVELGGLDLGTAKREATITLEQIADPGDTWTVRFSYAGRSAGEVVVTRSALEVAGWRLEIPTAVGDRLQAEGFPPSAR